MLKIIKRLLLKFIRDIDTGNSDITQEEELKIISLLLEYTSKDVGISKYQAAQILHVSRATFDNYVKQGILPKGTKVLGFKELRWFKKDLIEFLRKHNHTSNNKCT